MGVPLFNQINLQLKVKHDNAVMKPSYTSCYGKWPSEMRVQWSRCFLAYKVHIFLQAEVKTQLLGKLCDSQAPLSNELGVICFATWKKIIWGLVRLKPDISQIIGTAAWRFGGVRTAAAQLSRGSVWAVSIPVTGRCVYARRGEGHAHTHAHGGWKKKEKHRVSIDSS